MTVPVWEHVAPHVERLNPDGVHWPSEVHATVGRAVASAVLEALARRAGGTISPRA